MTHRIADKMSDLLAGMSWAEKLSLSIVLWGLLLWPLT